MVAGVLVGAIVWFAVTSCIAEGVMHDKASGVAVAAGAIAAVWIALPFIRQANNERYNMLFPDPKRYQIPWKNAFGKVRDILARSSYKMGNKWQVTTSDTIAKHIHATLQFTEEEFAGYEGGSINNIRSKTQHVKRFIEVDIQFKEEDDASVVQLDFGVQVEGLNYAAADFVLEDLKAAIDGELGGGTTVESSGRSVFEPPPWWLLGITGLMLLGMVGNVWTTVFKQ
jgi:hypothetical protein